MGRSEFILVYICKFQFVSDVSYVKNKSQEFSGID